VVGGVLKMTCPYEDREDVESEVWKRIWRYGRSFDIARGGTVGGLIAQVARHAAHVHIRSSFQRRAREESFDDQKLDFIKSIRKRN